MKIMTEKTLPFLMVALALGLTVGLARADAEGRVIDYRITRNGDDIGTHRVRFERGDSQMTLEHEISIRVRILALEAYRYDLRAREVWREGRLVGFSSTTDRNGDAVQVFARRGGSGIRVRAAGGERVTVPGSAIPADPHWNVLSAGDALMIEAEDGALRRVRVSGPRTETLTLAGRRLSTHRYDVTGEHDASLWYDEDGYLVKKRLRASDGSTVITQMR
ncbi:MAG TPA: hypothetical protein DEF51_40595 [Myxococcales bacterium]|nr:hypothetical protein [Myxococcales bacterium]